MARRFEQLVGGDMAPGLGQIQTTTYLVCTAAGQLPKMRLIPPGATASLAQIEADRIGRNREGPKSNRARNRARNRASGRTRSRGRSPWHVRLVSSRGNRG